MTQACEGRNSKIYFCNELSLKFGYEPVYSIEGNTDILNTYVPFESNNIYETIEINKNADGFRLPTVAEWIYAAKGGEDYKYAGSNDINEIAILDYDNNHEDCVAMKKPNGYGLYDMNGNVFEWTDDINNPDIEYILNFICGGSFFSNFTNYKIDKSEAYPAKREIQLYDTGIRLVRSNICKTVSTNLKLRSEGNMTSQVLLILSLDSKVKILEFGKSEIIDGMNTNWVKVEVISGKERDGNKLKSGMTGWCYGGYLELVVTHNKQFKADLRSSRKLFNCMLCLHARDEKKGKNEKVYFYYFEFAFYQKFIFSKYK